MIKSDMNFDVNNLSFSQKIIKPWGEETIYTPKESAYTFKQIKINDGCRLSLQSHTDKSETFILISGKADLLVGLDINPLYNSSSFTGVTQRPLRINYPSTGYNEFFEDANYIYLRSSGKPFAFGQAGAAYSIVAVAANSFFPTAGTNQTDLGTSNLKWRNLYVGTSAFIDNNLTVTGSVIAASFTGSFSGSLSGTALTASYINPLTQSVGIKGTGTTSGTTALTIQNANGSASFVVRDDGNVYANGPGFLLTNTIFGANAFTNNTSGSSNTAFGYQALFRTTGDGNTGVGKDALLNNTSGYSNTAIGAVALSSNTVGVLNTAVGFNTQPLNTAGTQNTSLGHESLRTNVSGSANVAIGYYFSVCELC